MTRFREHETEQFPVDRTDGGIWYAIIAYDNQFSRFDYTPSGIGKKEFIRKIALLKQSNVEFLLLGIWHGEYRTDIFVLDENIIVPMIKKEVERS
jgi:hypothetical protein